MVRRRPASRRPAPRIMAGLMLGIAGLTGCAARSAASPPQAEGRTPPIPLAAAESVPGFSWATVRTGGPAVGGLFWQLLVRDRPGGRWRLATPSGVADNGGLAVTRADDGTITAGFVPSQLLRFTPLAVSSDAGAHWSQGLLPAGLSGDPDSLASVPGGRLVAITAKAVRESASGTTGWTSVATLAEIAATPAGRRCGLAGLTGAVAEPNGSLLVAGACRHPGAAGLFAATASGWQRAGPVLPASLGVRSVSVIGLIGTRAGTATLLAGLTGRGGVLIPAWLAAGSGSWRSGVPVSYSAGRVESVSASASGVWAVALSGRRGLVTVPPPGLAVSHRDLAHPIPLPADHATLVPGAAGGELTALVPGLDTVTVWELTAHGGWRRGQVLSVPSAPGGQSH